MLYHNMKEFLQVIAFLPVNLLRPVLANEARLVPKSREEQKLKALKAQSETGSLVTNDVKDLLSTVLVDQKDVEHQTNS